MTLPSNMALTFEAKKVSDQQLSSGARKVSFLIEPGETPGALLNAAPGSVWTLAAVRQDENGAAVPAAQPSDAKAKVPFWDRPAPQVAALLCGQVKFQNWLNDHSGAVVTDEEAAKLVIYRVCGVSSRSQLPNPAWDKLVRRYRDFLDTEITEMYGRQ